MSGERRVELTPAEMLLILRALDAFAMFGKMTAETIPGERQDFLDRISALREKLEKESA